MQAKKHKRRGSALRVVAGVVWLWAVAAIWGGELHILSLNAEWYPGRVPDPYPTQCARHILGLQALLAEQNPDLLLLQEIQQVAAVTNATAVLPDYEVLVHSAFPTERHQFVIAGRVPVTEAAAHAWEAEDMPADITPPRGFSYVVVTLPDATLLPVFTVHFKSNYRGGETYDEARNVAMRETSARLLVRFAKELEDRLRADGHTVAGVVMGGDLNTTYPVSFIRGEQTSAILRDAGFQHLGGVGVDHFWGRGIVSSRFQVISGTSLSDHSPIALSVPLPGQPEQVRAPPRALADVASLAGNPRTRINEADAAELYTLPGIGPVLAARMLTHRPFASVGELVEVCGIGPATLEAVRDWIEVVPSVEDGQKP